MGLQKDIAEIFDRLGEILSCKRYDECDGILKAIDAKTYNLNLLLAILKGTCQVKDNLPSREAILEICKQRIVEERTEIVAEQLLKMIC